MESPLSVDPLSVLESVSVDPASVVASVSVDPASVVALLSVVPPSLLLWEPPVSPPPVVLVPVGLWPLLLAGGEASVSRIGPPPLSPEVVPSEEDSLPGASAGFPVDDPIAAGPGIPPLSPTVASPVTASVSMMMVGSTQSPASQTSE